MDVIVVATFEEFDETLDKRQRGPGVGRKHTVQALVHHLCQQREGSVRKFDVLILDWKNPPKGAAKEVEVSLHRGASKQKAIWGSRDQLIAKFSSQIWDLAICSQPRRLVLDLAGQLKVKRRLSLAHDYNLPFGPWGQELTNEQMKEHHSLCEKFEFLCTSQHLSDFVQRWGEGRVQSKCSYAADYGYFDPVRAALQPWDAAHSFVTLVSPCPEKGLCILAKLSELLPQVKFQVIKTVAWTKPWHEQLLKKLSNVTLRQAEDDVGEILKSTRVLLLPSVAPEAFSHLAVEAQLRGVPVVSARTCGLVEANFNNELAISDLPIVFDPRTHELVVGMTMDDAEVSLPIGRAGALTMDKARQAAVTQESHQKLAAEEDAERFAAVLRPLLEAGEALRSASEAGTAAAVAHVEGRRGRFVTELQAFLEAGGSAAAATLAISTGAPVKAAVTHREGLGEPLEQTDFDVNQDFTKDADFDGLDLAARCLVRLCEQGNITVAAELIQARADVNRSESEIGVTALIGAANAGHLDICKYLFRKDADVNLCVADGTKRTALHAASQMGFASVVQLLLVQQADPRFEDLTKTTPLLLACRYGHAGAAELLLKKKANPNQSDDQGQVPINDGVAKDRFDIVSKLLEHNALVNVRNMAGLEAISFSRTPQMQALIMKHDVHF